MNDEQDRKEPTLQDIESELQKVPESEAKQALMERILSETNELEASEAVAAAKAAAATQTANAPQVVQPREVVLAYNVPDSPAETPHQIYRFGTDGKTGADVKTMHSRAGRSYSIQPIRFKGVEVNNYETFGALLQAGDQNELTQLLHDLAQEAPNE